VEVDSLDVVDFDLLVVTSVRLLVRVLVVGEIEVAFTLVAGTVGISLVDSSALRKFTVLLWRKILVWLTDVLARIGNKRVYAIPSVIEPRRLYT
jgi:hypothetical protein